MQRLDKWSKSLSRSSLTFETQILKALAISNRKGRLCIVVTADERANPSVAWFALEHKEDVIIGSKARGLTWFELEEINRFSTEPKVVINQAFADELEVVKGDELQLGWFVRNQNGIERVEQNFSIEEVVEMAGQGQLAGTTTPPSLPISQQLKSCNNPRATSRPFEFR